MEHNHKQGAEQSNPDKSLSSNGQYYCPMLCEGDKKYNKPGDCPVCGMDLVKEQKASDKIATEYTCPMHPEIIRDEPGSCPICGMDLEPVDVTKEDQEDEKEALKKLSRKFWIATIFTIPVLFLSMAQYVGIDISLFIDEKTNGWIQFILSTPV
ncbi:ATPase, partial [Marivirga lumbricoides]